MKTIETIALSTVFKEDQIENLLTVCAATPNPSIGLEILLGIYKEPLIETKGLRKMNSGDQEVTFVSFDKWTNNVRFSYVKNKTVGIYVKKDTDVSQITEENYKSFCVDYGDDTKHFTVKKTETELSYDKCDLSYWNGYVANYKGE